VIIIQDQRKKTMNNYCTRCQKNTEDVVSVNAKIGLKTTERMCTVECEVCGVVKFSGRIHREEHIEYTGKGGFLWKQK